MHPTLEAILAGGPVILDGGWGTELQKKGLEIGAHPDLLNLSDPQAVYEVAKSYVEAGSEIILSNTFGSTRFPLARDGNGDPEQVRRINLEGVKCSKKAAGDRAKVFASMGPTGIMLISGTVSPEDMEAAFLQQAQALAEGGADGIVVETMSDPEEAVLAVKAAKTTGLPVVACMVFDSGKGKDRTMMGTTPEQAIERLSAAGADVIGSNCGQGIEGFISLCARMKKATDLPLWMKANAGLPEIVEGKTVYRQSPEEFAAKGLELIEAGARFLGGCCGTDPEFIAAIKSALKR